MSSGARKEGADTVRGPANPKDVRQEYDGAVELNDTGAGMPLTLGGGGYGGSDKTTSSDGDEENSSPSPDPK